MKLLLCHPSQKVIFSGVKARPAAGPPLGLLYLAAYARETVLLESIEIYDARLSGKIHTCSSGHTIFGDNKNEIEQRIKNSEADVIGISNMFSSQINQAYKMADIARQASPNSVIIIGGPHVTLYPLEALNRPSIDYVIIGEGEERLSLLLNAMISGEQVRIPGVIGKPEDMRLLANNKKSPVTFIDPMDKLPIPAYDLVDMEAYFRLGEKGYSPRYREWGARPITMLTSRGCPHKCVFCSIQTTMGYKYRYHSTEYVKKHISHLIENYDVDFIHFEDDNFTHSPERYDEIIDYLLTLKPKIMWDTPNGVRGDIWSLSRITKAKKSGCQFLTVAIESAVQNILDNVIRKRLDLAKVQNMIQYCHTEKLRLHAFYIIGFPGETLDDMKSTIEFALAQYNRYGVTPFLQPLIPIPGTEVYQLIEANKYHQGQIDIEYNQVSTPDFTKHQVKELYQNYLKRRMLLFIKRTLTSPTDFLYNIRLVAKYPKAIIHALRNAFNSVG
jgi:radical SAM superfamily enzyme YgiQ (UPF0313 family)